MHTDNVQRFNHGKGFVIGHQWTNIVLVFNDVLIPLAPIPFYSKKYCREEKLEYKTEHESVIEYITNLKLEDYIGKHNPEEVIVLADSGYDNKDIEKVIAKKKWKYIIALKKKRGVKSEKQYSNTPKSKEWSQVAAFFKNRLNWDLFIPENFAASCKECFRADTTRKRRYQARRVSRLLFTSI